MIIYLINYIILSKLTSWLFIMIAPKKTKVVLSDYPYRKDIESRLSLSSLTLFEVDVLREILHHSLEFPILQLADILDTNTEKLIPVLDKLSATKLFKRDHLKLTIDKEKRKYFELQLEKFEDDFEPNLEFLQGLLNKVPIHILPNWYPISRTSDNIFASIIEKYFLTPKDYRIYISELHFDNPGLNGIIKDLFSSTDFKIRASDLISKYKLTREEFEEYILLLEYSFVCCLRYEQVDGLWEEFITPFQEYMEYLLFEVNTKAKPIKDNKILPNCAEEFWFMKDLSELIKSYPGSKMAALYRPEQLKRYVQYATDLGFINKDGATDKGLLWLTSNDLHKAHDLFNQMHYPKGPLWTQKNIRYIEKSLKSLPPREWIYLDDFLQGLTAPLGSRDHVTLTKKGKKWKYLIPTYTPEELDFVKKMITERLYELGIVSTGAHKGKVCFFMTQFGTQHLH